MSEKSKKLTTEELSEKSKKLTTEELNEKIKELRALMKNVTDSSLDQVETMVKKKPVETTVMGFTIGLILGLILGAAISKR
jgi:ElaB/YqjD/DUF883 family membrane-anchored ribosome-binding protein